jgi:hypothetical protein
MRCPTGTPQPVYNSCLLVYKVVVPDEVTFVSVLPLLSTLRPPGHLGSDNRADDEKKSSPKQTVGTKNDPEELSFKVPGEDNEQGE